jgi:hypothetical protein
MLGLCALFVVKLTILAFFIHISVCFLIFRTFWQSFLFNLDILMQRC